MTKQQLYHQHSAGRKKDQCQRKKISIFFIVHHQEIRWSHISIYIFPLSTNSGISLSLIDSKVYDLNLQADFLNKSETILCITIDIKI